MRCSNKFISLLIFLTAGLGTARGDTVPVSPGKLVDRIVAVVNGKPILHSELEQAKVLFSKIEKPENDSEFEKKVLDQLVNDRLVAQEIEHRGLTATEANVDRAIEGVMQQNGFRSVDELTKALRDEGMSLEEYRATVKKQIETSRLINTTVRPKVQITDQDVNAAMKQSSENAPTEWKSDVRMIFKNKPKATVKSMERLLRQIKAGIPFERLASRETEGPAKKDGGHIGWVAPEELQPELAKVLGQLKVGETSKVIETKKGFYILQVGDRQKVSSKNVEVDREKVRDELEKKGIDHNLELFVRGLREKANIEVKL